MNISILSIGDEVCIGQVVNTNASWIAAACADIGSRVRAHSVIGDSIPIIIGEITRLLTFSDVVIITGGLGPTHDDCTKVALCELYNDTLQRHEPTDEHLRKFFALRGREYTERQQTQALLPSACTVLHNAVGTAPGMMFEREGKVVFSLPGVPREMQAIMNDSILPYIRQRQEQDSNVMECKTLLTTGIVEADLADAVGDVNEFLEGQELAFLPSLSGVRLRITATAERRTDALAAIGRIEATLQERIGKYIYGEGNDTLQSVVGTILRSNNQTLSTAESCTGGLLGKLLTDISGSSSYYMGGAVTYANELKTLFADVQADMIATHGAVSNEVACSMAEGIRQKTGTTFGIGITGVAGPGGGSDEKPVGTVWIALATPNGVSAQRFSFGNNRDNNRERAAYAALGMLYRYLQSSTI